MKRNEVTSYYALYQDGSYVPLNELKEISKLPDWVYIVRRCAYYDATLTNSYQYSEFTFIGQDDEELPLKKGHWELVYLSREVLDVRSNISMSYRLLNHNSKTVTEFDRKVKGLNFFKEELFPKLNELNGIEDYNQVLILNKLTQLIETVNRIEKKLNG